MSDDVPYLTVDRFDLLAALERITAGAGRGRAAEARIGYHGGEMTVATPGGRITVEAAGWWPGEARLPLSWLAALRKAAPAAEPLRLEYRDSRLHVMDRSVEVSWQDAPLPPVSVPQDAPLPSLLRLKNPSADITGDPASGTEAEHVILASASRILAPLGITQRDLERLVSARRARVTGELDLR